MMCLRSRPLALRPRTETEGEGVGETEFLVTVDRIEGDSAVLVPAAGADGRVPREARLLWPVALLPPGAGEGVVLRVRCSVDPESTSAARRRVRELIDRLTGPAPGRPRSE